MANDRVTVTTSGFTLHEKQRMPDGTIVPGRFLGWFENPEDASYAFNKDAQFISAEFILRVRDGALIARKRRMTSRNVWQALWADRGLS